MSIGVYGILFLAGLAAGVINTVAGGGSVLTLPALIFAGVPAVAANATNRIGVIAQNCVAISRFRKEKVFENQLTWRVTLIGLGGAILGAFLASLLSDRHFELILAVLMLVLLVLILKKPKSRLLQEGVPEDAWSPLSANSKIGVLGTFFALGAYAGFLQAGVGIMTLVALGYLVRMDLVRGNYIKLVFILGVTTVAICTFLLRSVEIYWIAALSVTLGQMTGAYIGSWVALKKGEKWILIILTVAILASSAKLFYNYFTSI